MLFQQLILRRLRPPPALAGEAFAPPLPGARRNIAECSLGLKTCDQPFFTGDILVCRFRVADAGRDAPCHSRTRIPGYDSQRRDGACQPDGDLPFSLFNPN
jgi:hypothetical protein